MQCAKGASLRLHHDSLQLDHACTRLIMVERIRFDPPLDNINSLKLLDPIHLKSIKFHVKELIVNQSRAVKINQNTLAQLSLDVGLESNELFLNLSRAM